MDFPLGALFSAVIVFFALSAGYFTRVNQFIIVGLSVLGIIVFAAISSWSAGMSPRYNANGKNGLWRRAHNYFHEIVSVLKSVESLITAIATVLLSFATAGVGLIAYWQWESLSNTDNTLHETLVASNRAWAAAGGVDAHGAITGGQGLKIRIQYANTGKSPAIKWVQHFSGGPVPTPDPSEITPVTAGVNTDCDGLVPGSDGIAVFPNAARQEWANTEMPERDYSAYLPLLLANKAALVIKGCFVYETMHEPHKTWFCFIVYRNGKFSTIDESTQCADAHGAD